MTFSFVFAEYLTRIFSLPELYVNLLAPKPLGAVMIAMRTQSNNTYRKQISVTQSFISLNKRLFI